MNQKIEFTEKEIQLLLEVLNQINLPGKFLEDFYTIKMKLQSVIGNDIKGGGG
jgi:hypothetical protein